MRQEILTGVERRRRWSVDQKLRILADASAEGSCLSDVARRHDITRQQIYQWRRELRRHGVLPLAPSVFLPVEIVGEDPGLAMVAEPGPASVRDHVVEIVLRNGRTVRVSTDIGDPVLRRMIQIAEAS